MKHTMLCALYNRSSFFSTPSPTLDEIVLCIFSIFFFFQLRVFVSLLVLIGCDNSQSPATARRTFSGQLYVKLAIFDSYFFFPVFYHSR